MRRTATLAAVLFVVSLMEGCRSPTTPTPVIPNVAGRWSGQHVIARCSDTLQFQGFCAAFNSPPGASRPMTLTLTQSGDQLSGTIGLGSSSGTVSGVINFSGQMILNGTYVNNQTFTIRDWSTAVSGGNMTGGWSETVTLSGLTGSATIDRQIQVLSKIA